MAEGLQMGMRRIPLVATGDFLFSRWWNQFRLALAFVTEAVWRTRHGVMVPADAETVVQTPENLANYRGIYPVTPDWLQEDRFPTGVPVPTPPAVFYYHQEIVQTADTRQQAMWQEIIRLEWAALFTAAWWHEAARGRRG